MSRRDQPYIPLYVMDFLTDEKLRECSASSVGVYIMMMCVMHKQEEYGRFSLRPKDRHGEDILNDFAIKLAKHLPFGVSVIADALQELLEEKVLYLENGQLIQKRMVRDGDLSEKRASAGKRGSETTNARLDAVNSRATESAIAKGEAVSNAQMPNLAEETPIESEAASKTSRKSAALTRTQLTLFERFYAAYPKKVDRATAERAWAKIVPQPDEAMTERIIQAIQLSKKFDSRFRERQFTPNPASWLNAKGYLNEYPLEGDSNYGDCIDQRNAGSSASFEEFEPSSGFRGS